MSEMNSNASDPSNDLGSRDPGSTDSSEPAKPLDRNEEKFSEVNLALEDSDSEDRRDERDKTEGPDSPYISPNTSPRAALNPDPKGVPLDEEKIVVKFQLGGTPEVSVGAESPVKETDQRWTGEGKGVEEDDSVCSVCCAEPEKRKKMVRTVFVLWNFLVFVSRL